MSRRKEVDKQIRVSGRGVFGIYAGLALITLAVYARALGNGFVLFDDPSYVTDNPYVNRGLNASSVLWAFSSAYAANWHPLTWISHMADCSLFGLEPWGHHLTNVLLHTANVLVLFALLVRMTGNVWKSAFVAGAFALHPLHVESVAWISERKDVLSALFWLLCSLAYVGYAEQPSFKRYAGTTTLLALGLMAKQMLVTLPFVFLILDFWPLDRTRKTGWKRLIAEKIPLMLIALLASVITIWAQREAGAFSSIQQLPPGIRFANAPVAYWMYLVKTVWPWPLAFFYPHPLDSLPVWLAPVCGVLFAGVTAGSVAFSKRTPWVAAGWLWYTVTLLPVIGIVQVGSQGMADRYSYISLIGVFIAIAWSIPSTRIPIRLQTGLSIVILTLWAAFSVFQIGVWKNSVSLFSHAARTIPYSFAAHLNLGVALAEEGRHDQALPSFEKALSILPDDAECLVAYAQSLKKVGRLQESYRHLQAAVSANPRSVVARLNWGLALADSGDLQGALRAFEESVRLDPNNVQAQRSLGAALLQSGRYDEAAERLLKSHALAPLDPEGLPFYAQGLALTGQYRQAAQTYRGYLIRYSGRADVTNELAWLLATCPDKSIRDGSEALRLARLAVKSAGERPEALDTLAAAQAANGLYSQAADTASNAAGLARRLGNVSLAKKIEKRLSLYKSGRPFHYPEGGFGRD